MAEPIEKKGNPNEYEVKRNFKTSKKEYQKGDKIIQENPDSVAYLKSLRVI